MEDGEAELSLGEILSEALVVCVLLQTEVCVVVPDLEVQAQGGSQGHEVGVRARREQLHQPDGKVE